MMIPSYPLLQIVLESIQAIVFICVAIWFHFSGTKIIHEKVAAGSLATIDAEQNFKKNRLGRNLCLFVGILQVVNVLFSILK